jgi:XrtJ-associated TM-motif-TM protein
MKKILIPCALLLIASASLHAQGGIVSGGCTNSPENPTAILAVVGSASAFFVSARTRLRARRDSSK